MSQSKMTVSLAVALGSIGALGLLPGCNGGSSTEEGTTDEAALKAASPACVSARDACKTQLESIASSIEKACTTPDACKAAFDAAKPDLQAAAKACETSIESACVVDMGGHGAVGGSSGHGAFAGNSGHGAFGGDSGHGTPGNDHDGGLPGHGGSAACQDAETACHDSLQSFESMPPTECAAIPTACMDQKGTSPSDACKTAISDCRSALMTAGAGTHASCGSAIIAACGRHAG